MRRLIAATEGERRQLVDGVKLWKSDEEWVLIIPHSDRAYFVVTAEARTEARTDELIAEYSRLVERWRDEA
jgi:phosphomannomutase